MDSVIQITEKFLEKRPLSATSLKKFGGLEGNPRKYIDYITRPSVDKQVFVLGRAVEHLIYEAVDKKEWEFNKHFRVYNKFEKRTNEAKERWRGMVEAAKDDKVTLIDDSEIKVAQNLADIALQTDETRYYLDRIARDKNGKLIIQKKLFWKDKATGLPIIGYIDLLCEVEGHFIVVDIKTDQNGSENGFIKNAKYNDYIIQVGSYLTGFKNIQFLFPDFMFMVIDKQVPYDASMFHCEPDYCEQAKDEFDHLLKSFKYCMDNNQFDRGAAFWDSGNGYFGMNMSKWDRKNLKHSTEN